MFDSLQAAQGDVGKDGKRGSNDDESVKATFIVGDGLSEVLQMAANAYDCVFFRADSLQLDTRANLYWL